MVWICQSIFNELGSDSKLAPLVGLASAQPQKWTEIQMPQFCFFSPEKRNNLALGSPTFPSLLNVRRRSFQQLRHPSVTKTLRPQ